MSRVNFDRYGISLGLTEALACACSRAVWRVRGNYFRLWHCLLEWQLAKTKQAKQVALSVRTHLAHLDLYPLAVTVWLGREIQCFSELQSVLVMTTGWKIRLDSFQYISLHQFMRTACLFFSEISLRDIWNVKALREEAFNIDICLQNSTQAI